MAFQVVRRAAQYGVARPAREMLFTAVSGWAFAGLTAVGLGLTGIALVALPLVAGWIAIALNLGRCQERLGQTGAPAAIDREGVSRCRSHGGGRWP